jgi:hypothetical protein
MEQLGQDDLKTIATLTTLQEAVVTRMIKRAVKIAPPKEHREFRAVLEQWTSEMDPGELLAFSAEFSRASQNKEIEMARALYTNFRKKKLHDAMARQAGEK